MKFLKKYYTFNEGLFSDYETDDQVAQALYDILQTAEYTPISEDNKFLIKDIKLDANPGTYNIYCSIGELSLKYYKAGVLLYTKDLDCGSYIKGLIFTLIEKRAQQ